jgi:hypothetical protein
MNVGLFARPANASANGVRPLEFIIGGDAGMKWGLSAVYDSKDNGAVHGKDLTLKFGLAMDGFEPYISYNAIGVTKDDTTSVETKTTGAWGVGFKYVMGEWAPYVDYARYASGINWQRMLTLGLGRTAKLGDNARLVYSLYAQKESRDSDDTYFVTRLPLALGVEGDPNGWLTLRAGVEYAILSKSSASNGTVVADLVAPKVGASIHVNKMDIDATLSNSTGNNIGFDSNTFTNVSVSYKW